MAFTAKYLRTRENTFTGEKFKAELERYKSR
jgi:hypothetical protein